VLVGVAQHPLVPGRREPSLGLPRAGRPGGLPGDEGELGPGARLASDILRAQRRAGEVGPERTICVPSDVTGLYHGAWASKSHRGRRRSGRASLRRPGLGHGMVGRDVRRPRRWQDRGIASGVFVAARAHRDLAVAPRAGHGARDCLFDLGQRGVGKRREALDGHVFVVHPEACRHGSSLGSRVVVSIPRPWIAF